MKSAFRPFLWIALVAAWVTTGCSTQTAAVGTGSHFRGPVGIQLYSLRAQFTRNVPQTIGTVKGFGIQEVELAGNNNLKNPGRSHIPDPQILTFLGHSLGVSGDALHGEMPGDRL